MEQVGRRPPPQAQAHTPEMVFLPASSFETPTVPAALKVVDNSVAGSTHHPRSSSGAAAELTSHTARELHATFAAAAAPPAISITAPRSRAQTQDGVIGAGTRRVASPFVVAMSGSPVFQVLEDEDHLSISGGDEGSDWPVQQKAAATFWDNRELPSHASKDEVYHHHHPASTAAPSIATTTASQRLVAGSNAPPFPLPNNSFADLTRGANGYYLSDTYAVASITEPGGLGQLAAPAYLDAQSTTQAPPQLSVPVGPPPLLTSTTSTGSSHESPSTLRFPQQPDLLNAVPTELTGQQRPSAAESALTGVPAAWVTTTADAADPDARTPKGRLPEATMPPSVTVQSSSVAHPLSLPLPETDGLMDGDVIAVRIVGNPFQYQLDPSDVREVFSQFAEVYSTTIDPDDACTAYVKVASGAGAEIARVLDGQPLEGMQGRLSCVVCPSALNDQPAATGVHFNVAAAASLLDLPLNTDDLLDFFLDSAGGLPAARCSTHAVLAPSHASPLPGLTADEEYGLANARGGNMGASTTPCGPSSSQGFYQQSDTCADSDAENHHRNTEMLGSSTPATMDYINMLLGLLPAPAGTGISAVNCGANTHPAHIAAQFGSNNSQHATGATTLGVGNSYLLSGGAGVSSIAGTTAFSPPWQRAQQQDDSSPYSQNAINHTPSRLAAASPNVHSICTPEPPSTSTVTTRFGGSHPLRGIPGEAVPAPDAFENGGMGAGGALAGSQTSRVRKWTARYDIQIEPDAAFQVTRKIIGTRGANMKKINQMTGAKLRLRGQGSGYLEGSSRQEAEDPLHLCISCTDAQKYKLARTMTEKLLRQIYADYDQWMADQGQVPSRLKIRYRELLLPSRNGNARDQGAFGGEEWSAVKGASTYAGAGPSFTRSVQPVGTPPLNSGPGAPGAGSGQRSIPGGRLPGGLVMTNTTTTTTTTGQSDEPPSGGSRVGTVNDDGLGIASGLMSSQPEQSL